MDAFPSSDLGLRNAFANLSSNGASSEKGLEETALSWSPWRALAFNYLLRP